MRLRRKRERTILCYRDFRRFHGGHLKYYDYFEHIRAADGFTPRIAFGPKTTWDPTNPWIGSERYIVDDWQATPADAFMIAGRGWTMVDEHPSASPDTPVLNRIGGLRHADPDSNRFEFLTHKAIRICSSEQTAIAIRKTGVVNGPVLTILNGVEVDAVNALPAAARETDVLVAALKKPELGADLASALAERGHRVELLSESLPRADYLDRVRRARVAVFLPLEEEGFYLPPLEAMALGTQVVCPDCIGNRSFCVADETCLVPAYTPQAILAAAEAALALDPAQHADLLAGARRMANRRNVAAERRAVLDVLGRLDELWAE